tara:strand:- start:75 stop:818 length:744 start_codon:yes stop_codon:yes gene_type:complete
MAIGKQSPFKLFGSRRRKREQQAATDAFNTQMSSYQNLDVGRNIYGDYQNVYADAKNVYADAKNVYEGMENPFEDLKVDTTGVELSNQQFAQSQADQLAALGGGVGGSGFGALTSTMSRQAAQQAANTQADIAQRLDRNEMAKATGAANIQQAERAGADAQQQMILSGADQQQQLVLSGADQQQQMIYGGEQSGFDREFTQQQELLAMAAGRKTAADEARANNTQMWMGLVGDVISAGGQIASAGIA